MGWSTTIVSPPDGHMGTYIASLERLLDGDDRTYWPTHGAPIRDPKPHVESLVAHRRRRVREVESCLRDGIDTIPEMVARLYRDLPARMHPAAARSVLSTMTLLIERGDAVRADAVPGTGPMDARYALAERRRARR